MKFLNNQKFSTITVTMLSNKLKYYFENKIKIWLKCKEKIFILNKSEYFYEIDIYDKQISKFIETNDNSIIESMIVKELCNKNIIDLSYGFSHYIARTYDNKFYCWGNNYFGQLGFGSEDQNEFHKNIPKLNNFLSDLNINAIKRGVNHSLALTQSGEVYGWGCNEFGQIGCGDNNVKVMPTKVTGLNENKIKMISCGENHSLALTESGCVYSWGDNSRGALGFENIEKSNTPKQIEIKDNFIDKITCGAFHCLLLTKNGDIFAFGSNNFGQVGNGMIGKNQFKPEKVNHENIFIDIAAHFDESISIALSFDNTY